MSKRSVLIIMVLLLLTFSVSSMAHAQDRTPIALGEWIKGTITDENYENKYTFTGKQGQLIMVTMLEGNEGGDLDSFVVLRNLDGDIIGQNDDVPPHHSLVLAELPADGDYVIVATRLGGKDDGDTTGDYQLQVTEFIPISVGAKTNISLVTDEEKDHPYFFVLHPAEDIAVHFSFIGQAQEIYPDIGLFQWIDNEYPPILLQTYGISHINTLTFSADLTAGNFYVLEIEPAPLVESGQSATLAFSTE